MAMTASQMHIADLVEQDEASRLEHYSRAWKAYDGEGPTYLEVEANEPDDNIRIDYPALIVDKGVSFLMGKDGGVTLQPKAPDGLIEPAEGGGEDEGEQEQPSAQDREAAAREAEERAAARLDAAWPPHKRHLDLHNLATNGGVCGHMWARIYKDGRVSILDPANCRAQWLEDDVDILKAYFVEWTTTDEEGLGIVRRWRIEPDNPRKPASWTIYLEENDDDHGAWIVIEETAWPYDFAPIIEGQNLPSPNTFHGTADLKPAVLDMIEQLESIASDMRRIVRHHGHPIPAVIGEELSKLSTIDVAVGRILAIPNEKAKLDQLDIAELTSSLELFRELKTALLEATRIPKVALGETTNAGPTAGVALKVEYEPLVEKTGTKHLTYGFVISEISRRLLALAGMNGWTVVIGWPDSMPSDPKADAEADESEIRMGIVSKRTISEKRGYDWEQEQQRIAEEAEASAAAMTKAFREGNLEDE